jgi:undecaprenyl-diphosphatase
MQGRAANVIARVAVLAVGFAVTAGLVYEAGIWLVPLTDATDKVILEAINPDVYLPGVDEFFRALTDYTNFLILAPLVAYMVALGLYRLFPKHKSLFVGFLAAVTLVVAALAALGQIWPNKTYVGANVLLVLGCLAAFGTIAWLFHRMDDDTLHRFGLVVWLVLLSGIMADFWATQPIKNAVARPRPFNAANAPWNEKVRIIPDEVLRGANSYPSGHTTGTFALLTPLFWFTRSRRVRTGLLCWAILLGVSRVYTGEHFPFCCLMGAILGSSVGTLVFFLLGGPSLWRKPVEGV